MAPRFRADQIGSLLRPQHLLDAQHAVYSSGSMHNSYNASQDDIKHYEDTIKETIKEVISQQREHGVLPITSGEFERSSFVAGFFEKLEGIEIRQIEFEGGFRTKFAVQKPYKGMGKSGRDEPVAVGKVRWKESTYMKDWLYLRSLLPEDQWKNAKMCIPCPNWAHTQLAEGTAYDKGVYANDNDYLDDLGNAVRSEILALYDAGCRYIQIDDPMVGMYCDYGFLDAQKAEGNTMDKLLDPVIYAHRACSRDMPKDLTLALHLCRGNLPKGVEVAVGPYDEIAPRLFRETHYKRFCLEWDDEEVTGSFSLLEYLPKDAAIVLGIVTTKDPVLEKLDFLKSKVQNAADIIAKGQGRKKEEVLRDNICVSPGCGFASLSTVHGIDSSDIQWQKLELVKQVAESTLG